jgi:hypothetical protein
VEPFPDNLYPIEFTSAQVTCAAFDEAGVKFPEKILFMRRDQFNNYVELKPNGHLHFDNRSTLEGNYIYVNHVEVHVHVSLAFTESSQLGNYN